MEKAIQYRGSYPLQQRTGGRGDVSVRASGLVPFPEVGNPRRSVDKFYERLHDMEGEALAARRKGLTYKGAAQLKAMRVFEGQMKALSKMAESAPADRKPDIRQRQAELARRAIKATGR